ncbi:MAG TPA: hypothetical protein VI197_09040 [Polyangiaceae bacterium]
MKRVGLSFLLLAGAVGCKASVNAEAKAGASGSSADADASFEASAEGEGAARADDFAKPKAVAAGPDAEATIAAATGPALLGARRDLKYQGAKQATCSCLAVAVGAPSNSAFSWEHGPPIVDGSRQLVIGLSSEGVSCSENVGLGASYKGYQTPGNDVVVMVERAHEGRPVTSGAVIPRPIAGGQVYVVAAEPGSPFGGAIGDTKQRCKLELPAAAAGGATERVALAPAAPADEEPEFDEVTAQEPSEFVDSVEETAAGEEKVVQAPETRDGFFLAFHPGGSYLILDDRDSAAKVQGFGFGLDVLLGGALTEGLTLGVILGGGTHPNPKIEGGDLEGVDLNPFHIGAFIDYYTDPASGFHLLGELGYVQIETTGSDIDSLTTQGLLVAAGLGYDWWVSDSWSLGLFGRFGFGAVQHSQTDTKQWLLLPALNFTATYH